MLDKTGTLFSHVKPGETEFVRGGLRDFFLYRDLGVAAATHGKVVAHLVKANLPPDGGTGWHIHVADFQIVVMTKGWAMMGPDIVLAADVALFDVDAIAFAAMSEHFIDQLKAGEAHPAMPSMMKYAGTELNKTRNELIMAAGGSRALEWDSEETEGGKTPRNWLRTKANSIEGGTSEVMLNVISKRILDLPGA